MLQLARRSRLPVVVFAEGGGGRPGDTDCARRRWPRHHDLHRLRAAERPGAARRHRLRAMLRRQRRAARLLRRHHRHRERERGHGRPGHDRGRWARRLQAGGGRSDRRPGAERRRRRRRRRRGRGRARGEAVPRVLPGPARRLDLRGPAAAAPAGAGEPAPGLRHPSRRSRRSRTRARCSSCGRGSASGIVTALVRIEGRPLGLIANNPMHLGGAIDADAADKAARFVQLCDAFDLPIVSLCDTPGFMVGPDAEKTALVRHVSRMFVAAAASRCRGSPSCCGRATVSARRRWPAGASTRRTSSSRGRAASSAAWGSRARCASATGRSSPRSTIPRNGRRCSRSSWRAPTSRGRRSTWPRSSRSTT